MNPIKELKRWRYAFINTNQMMAILDHCPIELCNPIGESFQMVPMHFDLF
jgi:hypothetical protein